MTIIKKKTIYAFFFVCLLTKEFFYIHVGDGVARVYHLLAPLVILALYQYIPRLFVSRVFLALFVFFLVNLIAVLMADYPMNALKSLGSLTANIGVATAVALILVSNKYDLEQLVNLIVKVTLLAVCLGAIQIVLYKFSGINLSLSEEQITQVSAGFAPGFRTEANTFAKYLNFVFLLILPRILKAENYKKSIGIFVIIFIGMLMNLTRSALYGLSLTLMLTYFWYLFTGRGKILSPKVMTSLGLGVAALLIFSTLAGDFNEYAVHKITTFFDKEEILEGGSSGFRLMSQGHLIDAFLATDKSMLIGNGWGQVYFDYGGEQWQAGGAEILTALAYGGIFSGVFYLIYTFSAMNVSRKLLRIYPNDSANYEGVMFAIFGSVITGQINGAMIAPEYWMMYGIAIYFGYKFKAKR